jgi:hypothetical protein
MTKELVEFLKGVSESSMRYFFDDGYPRTTLAKEAAALLDATPPDVKALLAIDQALRGRVNDPDPLPVHPLAAVTDTTYGLVAGLLRERDKLKQELATLRNNCAKNDAEIQHQLGGALYGYGTLNGEPGYPTWGDHVGITLATEAGRWIKHVRGCFEAAEAEGLSDVLAEYDGNPQTKFERLHDIVARRLMPAITPGPAVGYTNEEILYLMRKASQKAIREFWSGEKVPPPEERAPQLFAQALLRGEKDI